VSKRVVAGIATEFCPNCEREQTVDVVNVLGEKFVLGDEEIEVDTYFVSCQVCGRDYDVPRWPDPLEEVYRIYRERTGREWNGAVGRE